MFDHLVGLELKVIIIMSLKQLSFSGLKHDEAPWKFIPCPKVEIIDLPVHCTIKKCMFEWLRFMYKDIELIYQLVNSRYSEAWIMTNSKNNEIYESSFSFLARTCYGLLFSLCIKVITIVWGSGPSLPVLLNQFYLKW